MSDVSILPESLAGLAVHLVGAKGTGMAALAEILSARGALLTGSDVADSFYTDAILKALKVDMRVGFEASHLPPSTLLVIHSAAYGRDSNPELLEAGRLGIPMLNYPEALGALSRRSDSSGIAGVHGKTTTTALAGCLVSALGLPATVLAGSAVSGFGGRSTMIAGDTFFVAETCEYRKHFLSFRPSRIVLTSIESDHQDFFPTYGDIYAAFLEYIELLPKGGELIFCADDPGAASAAAEMARRRPDLAFSPYGFSARGDYRIESYAVAGGEAHFRLKAFPVDFSLRLPGRHLALDATAALVLAFSLMRRHRSAGGLAPGIGDSELALARGALASFSGSKRRSEILGEAGGIIFMDDYGHHPTAIRETIHGIREFWPERRLVVDFMSHTYSRTRALFDDFASSLDEAELLVLHSIYASARESPIEGITGMSLFEAAAKRRPARPARYFDTVLEGLDQVAASLRPGDLVLTMGAGDNWKLGEALLARFRSGAARP